MEDNNVNPDTEAGIKEVNPDQLEYEQVPKMQLRALLDQNKELRDMVQEYQASEDKIADVCKKAMTVLGLLDKDGKPIPELTNGDGVKSLVIRSILDKIHLTDAMLRPKKFEKDLMDNFGFIVTDLKPIIQRHAARKQNEQ